MFFTCAENLEQFRGLLGQLLHERAAVLSHVEVGLGKLEVADVGESVGEVPHVLYHETEEPAVPAS